MNRLQACLFLRMIPGLGNVSAKKLWEFSPSPQAIFDRSPEDFLKLEGIGTNLLVILKTGKISLILFTKRKKTFKKIKSKPYFSVITIIPKPWLFVPMPPWFCFTREISTFPSAS